MIRKFLLPGQYYISKTPVIIETLVGLCVSVCLYNAKTGCAAMNHFLQDCPPSKDDCALGRYDSTATEHIINTLMKMDTKPGHYRAQIFGGTKVIKTNSTDNDIGLKNIDIARKILTVQGIRIIRKEVGSTRGRRIRFDTFLYIE